MDTVKSGRTQKGCDQRVNRSAKVAANERIVEVLEKKIKDMSQTNNIEAIHAKNDDGGMAVTKDRNNILAYARSKHEMLQLQVSQCRAISERTQEELYRHPELDQMSRRMYKRVDRECDETIHIIMRIMELLEQEYRLLTISKGAVETVMADFRIPLTEREIQMRGF